MIQLSPVWIISLLPEVECVTFDSLVNNHFSAFTENELGIDLKSPSSYKWWGIDHVDLVKPSIDELINTVPCSLIQAYSQNADEIYIHNKLTVIVYGYTQNAKNEHLNSFIEGLKLKLPGSFTIMYYGIFFDRISALDREFISDLFENTAFDAVILQSECNQNQNNQDGYLNLLGNGNDDRSKVFGLASQLILNMAVGHGILSSHSNIQNNQKIFVAGGFSLTCEDDVRKSNLAKKYIALPIMDDFFNNENDNLWKNIHELPAGFGVHLKEIDAKIFYDQTILLFDDKLSGIRNFFKHVISPWALLSSLLIPKYFAYELKLLLQHLVEFGRLIDMNLCSQFKAHIKHNIESEKGLRNSMLDNIHTLAISLWAECNVNRLTPIGLKQFSHNLMRVREKLTEVKKSILNNSEFENIAFQNEPIKVPIPIDKEYAKIRFVFLNDVTQTVLSEAESDQNNVERNFIHLLKNKLSFHAIPLSLFFRAFLFGLTLSIISLSLIRLIPNFWFNTSYFKSEDGVIIWLVTTFSLPILAAFIHYCFLIIGKIRQLKKQYLAWVLLSIQKRLIAESREQILKLVDELIGECDKINNRYIVFSESNSQENTKNTDDYVVSMSDKRLDFDKLIFCKNYKYPITYFQQSIFDPIDQSSSLKYISDQYDSDCFIEIEHQKIPLKSLSLESRYQIFAHYFLAERRYIYFYEKVLLAAEKTAQEFANQFQNEIEKLIQSESSSFEQYTFTEDAMKKIQSRSYPSLFDYTMIRPKFGFYVASRDHLPIDIGIILAQIPDNSQSILPLIATGIHHISMKSFFQYCQFYRLSGIKDLNSQWGSSVDQVENN